MWKRGKTVTELERDKIAEIADKYEVPKRDVTSMFQSGLNFNKKNDNFVIGKKGTGMVRLFIKPINKFQIGDIVEIKAQVVDYNDGDEKIKLRISGYAANKITPVDRYIWVKYTDNNNLNKRFKEKQNIWSEV